MASELSSIKDEDLLRQMWLETEDFGRKKEIRSHMYKLREARLKDFYVNEMDSKAPITSRHGNSMADHSFESLKSNEIHGTDGPMRDIKFGPIGGNTGGWNVISSTETSDDGRARTDKMLATTEGVSAVDGGKKVFSGKNEELKTERYDGDANNFTYSTGESSNMLLNENIVTGDDSNKRMESKSSSVSHTSKVVRSSTNSGDVDFEQQSMHDQQLRDSSSTTRHFETQNVSNQKISTDTRSDNVKLSQDAATVEKAFRLAQQPGNIISRQVERANPTTNMIIEKKELADGTIVTTKRYETINSDNINGQTTIIRDNRTSTTNNASNAQHEVKKTSQNTSSTNVETTFKTARDEEAFRLSQQPGTVISRNVEMTDPNTRMITEKKELTDGTIVTTKRYEKVTSSSDQSSNVVRDSNTQSTKNFTNDTKSAANTSDEVRKTTTTTTNETFRTARDEEAFRLAQQPGKIISRDVTMTNPTTRMITEKKELTDGTIVTTKRYESVNSESQSTKSFTTEQQNINNQAKNLRNDTARDSTTVKKEEVRTTQTFKSKRDEEAFRLAQQPGVVLERNVEITNPTTKLVTEKKRLNDGTVVTTRVYETIGDDSQNVKTTVNTNNSDIRRTTHDNNSEIRRTTQDASNIDVRRSVHDDVNIEVKRFVKDKNEVKRTVQDNEIRRSVQDNNEVRRSVHDTNEVRRSTFDTDDKVDRREVVEEFVTKKNYDTSCHCPEAMHDHKTHAREFINRERNDEAYDVTKEIIVNVEQAPSKKPDFTEHERKSEEVIRREEIRRLEQKRVEDQVRRRVDESTRKITRELEVDSAHKAFASSLRCVTPPNERVTTPSAPRNDNRATRSPSRETTTSKISSSTVTVKKSTTNDVRRTDDRRTVSKSPEKNPKKVTPDSRKSTSEFTETEINTVTKNRTVNPQRITQTVPKTSSPTKVDSPRKPSVDKSAPKKSSPDSRDSSPQKPGKNAPKESSPTKSRPTSIIRDSSPQKPDSREASPSKSHPRDSNSTPRAVSPQKYAPTSGNSTPRDASPHKQPNSKSPSRDNSPNKPAAKTTRRDENEIFSSTVVVDNREKTFKDDLKIVQTIDTKNLSATTSVSDIEYIIPDRRGLITDLDSNDIEIKINVENFKNADDLQIKTTIHEIDDKKGPSTKKPEGRVPYNRSETFEERARKLIGVSSDNDDEVPHYAKPTYASFPSNSANRVSEIRERKAKIEQETQEIEQVTKKMVKNVSEDFITREKNESHRSTHHFSSPDQSPTRGNTKPTNKKPSENTKPHDNGEIIKTNVTKTVKTTETRHHSPEKKRPMVVETNKKVTSDHATTKKTTCECPVRHTSPETHITLAKIHISPPRGVTTTTTNKTTKTTELKVAPSIRLVKKPLTDVSSTEPDSDVETDQELIKNIDKATSKSTRKKLMQSRKETAPVTKTTTTVEKEKYSRSVTDSVVKTDTKKKMPAKDVSQPREASPKKETKRPTKCVTTKTINLTNVSAINSNTLDDVVIDVQQAKSSREPSPNKIIPIPVRPDEVINGQVIYPDKVTEPEDGKQKPKVKNIPIFEEQTKQFVGLEITEVSTDKSHVILEEEEHEDSIIESDTLERCDRKRNSVQIDPLDDEDEDDHAHLLSVSQKVNKFISTAEELKKPKVSAPFKSDDVRLEDVSEPEDDSMLSVNRKVTKFSTTNDETSTYEKRTRVTDSMTRSTEEVDENLVDDECLLSVSDKVNKFISTAEKLTSSTPQKSPELVKNAMKGTSKTIRVDGKIEDVNESFLTKEKVSTLTREDRSDSKSTLKSVGSDITLKSTEAIKRARAVFENNTAARDIKRHDDILSRPSVWEGKRTPTVERKTYKENVTTKTTTSYDRSSPVKDYSSKSPSYDRQSPVKDYLSKSPSRERQSPVKEFHAKSPSPTSPRRESSERTPVYLRDQVSTKKDLFEKRISSSKLETELANRKSLSPQTSVEDRYRLENEEVHNVTRKVSTDKHYMSHTVASLEHVNNERREAEVTRTSRRESRNNSRRESDSKSPTKFHRNISESTNDSAAFEAPRTPTKFGVELKRTDSGKQAQTRRVSVGAESIDIEQIFDLAELEKLLEIVVGYEQRRRIRAQIRVVRKAISDKKTAQESKTVKTEKVTSYSSPSRKSRDEGITTTKVTRTITEKPEARAQKIVTTTTTTTTRSGTDRPKEVTQTKTTRVINGAATPSSPRNIIDSLNKNSNKTNKTESVVKIAKKTSATSSTQKSNSTRASTDTTDCVTSSYGVGPTDSNGLPLFGLKALKKKSPAVSTTSTSKTTGTVVSEVSYSENGGPAVVERKTMKYSSDPSDFTTEIDSDYKTSTTERKSSRGGVYSVTKIEKFQDDGKSSVKTATVPSAKVIRRGSVKELKEKFVRKDSSSKVIESSSKSSTKRTSVDHHGSESESDSLRVSKTSYKSSSARDSKSFLNSEKKASNVQEVLTYMRNADEVHEDGDSKEDAEARALLNKFLGATALMTGIEKNSGLSKEFLSSGTASSKNPRASSASKTTKTVTSYSTSKAYDLNDIWDVDLLKKLLDSTTNYDDRRKIRARIREVMDDKEACAEIVAQLTADLDAAESTTVATSEKKEEETMTKTSSEVQQKGDRIIKTTTTEVITKSTMQPQPKMSPFAKFRQLDRQNSLPNSPSPRTPTTPTTPGGSKMFTFTDPALQKKAASVKDTLLMWCQIKTKEYENVNIKDFSSSWSDGLAFAALIHHFLPDAFDYSKLTPKERRHNFTLAFQIADDKAGIAPLLDVDDMVMYKKPDWKCVFCYVQSIYRRFKNED